MEDTLYRGNREPTLDQMLAEPIVRTIMQRDGVGEETVRHLMQRARRCAQPANPSKLNVVPPAPAAHREERARSAPQASIGVLAQAAAPHWPRIFPSL